MYFEFCFSQNPSFKPSPHVPGLRACACCIEIHKKLFKFNPGVEGVELSFHIGIGAGNSKILQARLCRLSHDG